jgi:pyruvate dehydrogenase kinase 2/3/4
MRSMVRASTVRGTTRVVLDAFARRGFAAEVNAAATRTPGGAGGGEGTSGGATANATANAERKTDGAGTSASAFVSEAATAAASATARGKTTGRKLGERFGKEVVDDIYRGSFRSQTGVSLKYMLDFGSQPIHRQLMVSAQFLHKELPVRLAHRVAELENLPFGLSDMSQVLDVRDWYVESFTELRTFPPIENMEDEEKFTQLLKRIMARHENVVPMIARAVLELKEQLEAQRPKENKPSGFRRGGTYATTELNEFPEVHQFLDGFYMSRIGMRMLIGQHVALHDPPKESYIGLICTSLSPLEVARDAIADARSICMREYGDAPEVELFGEEGFTFAYVPGHLHQMLFELIKNSLRAVSDKYMNSDTPPPPIRIVIAEGAEDVTIKVSDEGGGIRRSGLAKIWTYLYSTARSPLKDMDADSAGPVVLAGYGYGLPLSRLYARYFGGDLQVLSMENYGTDAYLHLNRLGNMAEPLP